jgi:hypothetical protein
LKLVMEEGERKLTSKLNHTLFFFLCRWFILTSMLERM